MVTVVLTATVFAKDKFDVNDRVKESFKKEFSGATSVKWETVKDLRAASFIFYKSRCSSLFQ